MSTGINILMYHQVGDFPPMKAHRSTYCDHRRFASQMAFLARFAGPALIEERESTCVVGPESEVEVDRFLNLVIELP